MSGGAPEEPGPSKEVKAEEEEKEAPKEAPQASEEAKGVGDGKQASEDPPAKKEEQEAEDSDDAWGDWTKKGKDEEKEDDEDEGWGDWTGKGEKARSSSKKEKTVKNPFTLILEKGKGKGDSDNVRNRTQGRHRERQKGGGRHVTRQGRHGNSHNFHPPNWEGQPGQSLAAQARAQALLRERSALERAAALGRAMLHRVIPPKARPGAPGYPMPPIPMPPLNMFQPPGFMGFPTGVPVRPGMPPVSSVFRPPMPPMPVPPNMGAPGGTRPPPGVWMPQAPMPHLPLNPARPQFPPKPPDAPTSSSRPQSPPVRPRQKARPTIRAPKPSARPSVAPSKASAGSSAAANGVKRPREEGFRGELGAWLENLDSGKGIMRSYEEVLARYDSWDALLEGAVKFCDDKKLIFKLEFLASTELKTIGHRIMLAAGLKKLIKERNNPEPAKLKQRLSLLLGDEDDSPSEEAKSYQPPKPQPKRRPQAAWADPSAPSGLQEEVAQLEGLGAAAEDEEMEEVACENWEAQEPEEPEVNPEDEATARLWQGLFDAPAAGEAEEAAENPWADDEFAEQEAPQEEFMEDEPPPEDDFQEAAVDEELWDAPQEEAAAEEDLWDAPQEEEAFAEAELQEPYEEDPAHLQEDPAHLKEEAEEQEEVVAEEEPVAAQPEAQPAWVKPRPFSAFGRQAAAPEPQVVPRRVPARIAKPPQVPPPAKLLQGRSAPPEPQAPPSRVQNTRNRFSELMQELNR